jgi:hypothetical protein
MSDLIVRDMRLQGQRPAGIEVLEVDENTPLDWPINWLHSRASAHGGQVRVRIMAHAAGFYSAATVGSYGGLQPQYSQGGAGVQFCQQGINLGTIAKFSRLHGKLAQIEILGCGAAYITPGREGKDGDGNVLCSRLAQITGASVRASTALQRYDNTGPIDFGRWEGTVLTYGPSGAVVKVEHAPAF